jgi:hypothetical protein
VNLLVQKKKKNKAIKKKRKRLRQANEQNDLICSKGLADVACKKVKEKAVRYV